MDEIDYLPTCGNLPFGGPAHDFDPNAGTRSALPDAGGLAMTIASDPEAIPRMAATAVWDTKTLDVGFTNPNSRFRREVERIASKWCEHCQIKFNFVSAARGDIIVNFDPDPQQRINYGYYASYHGIESRRFTSVGRPSLHLVFNPGESREDEFQRVILHEFGHALGCIHEHIRPGMLRWTEEVYRYYNRTAGWDRQTVDQQIVNPFNGVIARQTSFDPNSIMMYKFPRGLATLTNGEPFESDWNTRLTALDIQLIGDLYGRNNTAVSPPPITTSPPIVSQPSTPQTIAFGSTVEDKIDSPGQRRKYIFTVDTLRMVSLRTADAPKTMLGQLCGPNSETRHYLPLAPGGDSVNIAADSGLDPGQWYVELWFQDPGATGRYRFTVGPSS